MVLGLSSLGSVLLLVEIEVQGRFITLTDLSND